MLNTSVRLSRGTITSPPKGGFPVIAETTCNQSFSKEISQVIFAAMGLAPNFYCNNCLQVVLAMIGNPPKGEVGSGDSLPIFHRMHSDHPHTEGYNL